jgi:F-actin monooxygenase
MSFRILEKEFKISRVMSADESLTLQNTDIKVWLHYLEQICEVFRGEIPHVKHPKLDYAEFKQKNQNNNNQKTMADFAKLHRIAAARREAAKEENGASNGRKSYKLPSKYLNNAKSLNGLESICV